MAGAGGKGRISNELVAASCAAVLAVYAAGYLRTREESRRIDVRAQERRPAPAVSPPASTQSAIVQPPMASPASAPEAPGAAATARVASGSTQPTAPLKSIAATSQPELSAEAAFPPATAAAVPDADAAASITTIAAQPTTAPLPVAPPTPSGNWRDGTYTGWGTSRHGDIKAQVVIRDGRIVEAGIASCETRYPCDVIGDIIQQPVARQSPEVDRVSRATESADAYYFGLVEALKEALIPVAGQVSAPR